MTSVDTSDPRDSAYGRDYWLHRCEGFTVQRAGREVGKVTGLRFHASIEPELLEVRIGRFGKRRLIPVEQVQQIEPKKRRIILGASPVSAPQGNFSSRKRPRRRGGLTPLANTDVNRPDEQGQPNPKHADHDQQIA
jgi:hypothetical protein